MNEITFDLEQAADTLRTWALDESLKATVKSNPQVLAAARRIASRYIAGEDLSSALQLVESNARRGHLASIECVGESVRNREEARQETEKFIEIARSLKRLEVASTISLDLSHVGLLVDDRFCYENAARIAEAARAAGTYVMVSAEGSARTDQVLTMWERVKTDFPETGITLQARLHRSADDLQRVITRDGPIRLVKGAFREDLKVAAPRNSSLMYERYVQMASELINSGHRTNLATHDASLISTLQETFGDQLHDRRIEFEMLQGLGAGLLDSLNASGYRTREYVVYGSEWWLYSLNRLAEEPQRVFTALADLATESAS